MQSQHRHGLIVAAIVAVVSLRATAAPVYSWLDNRTEGRTIAETLRAPAGYARIAEKKSSFATWLRGLPLREAGTPAQLFDGREKPYQGGVYAVVDIDVGTRDLQQCADAVIRLRAEYLWQTPCADQITFNFTSGDRARWSDWRAGKRPVVSGNDVFWTIKNKPDDSYRSFRNYLNSVFTYAGSHSLSKELKAVVNPSKVQPGDVFIRGGFPGHAVLVIDVAENDPGQRVFLLVQSFMPAQDVHVLKNPAQRGSPWYPARKEGKLETPEWTFDYTDLRRFAETDCSSRQE